MPRRLTPSLFSDNTRRRRKQQHVVVERRMNHCLTVIGHLYSNCCLHCRAMLCRRAASGCLPHSCILSNLVNISSTFSHHWVATPFWFFCSKRYVSIPTGTVAGALNAAGVWKRRRFSTNISLHLVLSTLLPSCVMNTVLRTVTSWWHALTVGVRVQHSSEARVTVLLWPFVAMVP